MADYDYDNEPPTRDGSDQIMFLGGLLGFGIMIWDRIWPSDMAWFATGVFFALIAYYHFYSQTDPKKRR